MTLRAGWIGVGAAVAMLALPLGVAAQTPAAQPKATAVVPKAAPAATPKAAPAVVPKAAAAPAAQPKAAAATPAKPTTPNNRQAIEITADALEVQQDKRVAVFAGNVNAAQGEYVLRADKLTVHYAAGGGDNSISKIDATGSVFFSTAGQTAQGQAGTYDVDAGIITLTGAVVLTQGENVVRGNTLVLNLTTGQSRMDGGATGGGRVRGLFVPGGGPAAP